MSKAPGPQWASRGKRRPAERRARGSGSGEGRRSRVAPFLFQTLRKEEQGNDEQQHAKGDGSAKRPVVGSAEEADHDVGNHDAAGAAQQQRGEEVSEAEDEGKSRARE